VSTDDERLRILIVDDHPMFRNGIRGLLAGVADLEVIAVTDTGEEAIRLADELKPDVVLMDLQMPGMGGIEATQRILEVTPTAAVLIVTMFDDDTSVFAAMRAGARGYILKDAREEEMLRAIRAVGNGEAIFGPGIASRMLGFLAPQQPRTAERSFPELSEREREILGLVAQGLDNAGIAERLVLSPKTVRNYVSSIFSKLQVASRAQAIVRAREAGFGQQ
jgi:DNA-binding NarL/FixJ family response regulator